MDMLLPGRLCCHQFARGKGDSVEVRRDQRPGTVHAVDVWLVYRNGVQVGPVFTSPAEAYELMYEELRVIESA